MNYRSVSFINDVSLLKNKPWSFDFILLSTATEGPEKSVWDQATADRGEASWLPIPARYIWNNLQRVCLYSHNHAFFFVLKKNGQFWVNFNDIWIKNTCAAVVNDHACTGTIIFIVYIGCLRFVIIITVFTSEKQM